MLWMTWRQHRQQAALTAALLVLVGGYLLWTGLRAASLADSSGLDGCTVPPGGDCVFALAELDRTFGGLPGQAVYFNFLIVLVGVFWGAPLVAREVESGTHKLAWTQSVTRTRWLATKLVAILAGAALIGAIQGVLFWWWYGALDPVVESRLVYEVFDLQGIVPVGYALFAAAGGIAAGTFLPRTLAAMVLTAAAYVGIRVAISRFARPHYQAPVEEASEPFAQTASPTAMGGWGLDGYFVARDGHRLSIPELTSACPPDGGDARRCMTEAGITRIDVYHPQDRFWAFQAVELGIFLALTAALVGLVLWRIRSVR